MKFEPRLPDESPNRPKEPPLREMARLLVAAALITATLLLVAGGIVDVMVFFISPEAEARFFAAERSRVESSASGSERQASEDLSATAARLAAAWPENPYRFRVVILDDTEVNAYALPGGTIAVTSAMLEAIDEPGALEFVLAHEIGHFRGRDHLQRLGRGVLFGILLAGLGLGGESEGVAELTGGELMREHAVEEETRADAFAVEAVCAELGSAAGGVALFEELERRGGFGEWLGMLSDHPPSRERVEAVRDRAERLGCAYR